MTSELNVVGSGAFELQIPPGEAFPWFTAEGERLWAPGWDPQILGSLPQTPGLVFLTAAGGTQTIWTVIESDSDTLRHSYSRVTPGHSAGIVSVQLVATDAGTRVEVRYDMTALSTNPDPVVAAYSEPAFSEMMREWQRLISTALRDQAALERA